LLMLDVVVPHPLVEALVFSVLHTQLEWLSM
jgi:hypothetical protein